MSDAKFNAVTRDFHKEFRKYASVTRRMANCRRKVKRLANRLARRVWFDGEPLAAGWRW